MRAQASFDCAAAAIRCGLRRLLAAALERAPVCLQAEPLPSFSLPPAYADAKSAGSLGAKRVVPDQDPVADHCGM